MKTSLSSLLFSVGNSLKVNMKLTTNVSNEPNSTYDIISKNVWLENEYIRLVLNPYLELDFRNKYDYKTEGNKKSTSLKCIAISRRDVFALIFKLKNLVKNLYSDNGLFYIDDKEELKLNMEKSESFKVIHNTVYGDSMEFKPFLIKLTDNTVYEGVIIILRNDISLYSYLTTEELRYFIFELERVNFTLLATELFNTYISITEKTNNQEVKSKKVIQQNSNSSVESFNSNLGYTSSMPKI